MLKLILKDYRAIRNSIQLDRLRHVGMHFRPRTQTACMGGVSSPHKSLGVFRDAKPAKPYKKKRLGLLALQSRPDAPAAKKNTRLTLVVPPPSLPASDHHCSLLTCIRKHAVDAKMATTACAGDGVCRRPSSKGITAAASTCRSHRRGPWLTSYPPWACLRSRRHWLAATSRHSMHFRVPCGPLWWDQ